MATLKGNIFGHLSGKIGPMVIKSRDGKSYAASMPSKYTASQKPEEVAKRNRFSVNSQIAKVLKESELLFKVWGKANVPANNAHNKISKVNFRLCGTDRPTSANMITPDGFVLPVINTEVLPDGINIEHAHIDLKGKERKASYVMFVSFYNPVKKGDKFFELKRISEYEEEGEKVRFKFNVMEKQLAGRYKNKTVFFAAVVQDGKENIVRYSNSYGKDV